jgi:hypothetical protein
MRCAAFAGRHAGDDIRSILDHLPGMKRSFLAGDALHNQTRAFINENAQLLSPTGKVCKEEREV